MWDKTGTRTQRDRGSALTMRYVTNNKNYTRAVANNKLCIGMHADHIALRILPTFLPEKKMDKKT